MLNHIGVSEGAQIPQLVPFTGSDFAENTAHDLSGQSQISLFGAEVYTGLKAYLSRSSFRQIIKGDNLLRDCKRTDFIADLLSKIFEEHVLFEILYCEITRSDRLE